MILERVSPGSDDVIATTHGMAAVALLIQACSTEEVATAFTNLFEGPGPKL